MKSRRMAVYGLVAGLAGGGGAGLLMTSTTLAGAQTAGVTGTVTDPAAATADNPPDASARKVEWATAALDQLVADGTITQEQADKVRAALQAARPVHGPGHHKGRHRFAQLDAAAQALGVTAADLRTALEYGKSLADVARDKGVDPARVVDALVAERKAHLDRQVAVGRHTQAVADQMLAAARSRIEAFVNGTAPAGKPGFGFGGKGGRHGRGPMGGVPGPSGGSGGSGTTTTTTS